MDTIKLASAGDDIRIWDANIFSLEKQLNLHKQSALSIAWSRTEPFFCSASGDKVVVTYLNADYHSSDITAMDSVVQVALSSTSRYLAGGATNGTVSLWDLKSQKLRKSYKVLKSSVSSIQFNWDDTVLAASDESGETVLTTVSTGVKMQPLVAAKPQAIKSLQYSYYKKSLLGSCSDSGTVALWDTNTRQMIHSFDEHSAPAMGLAFSPVNETLLMSVGLDKKLVCYDTGSKKQVGASTADMPLTSIDIKNDGYTVVLGTTKGKLLIVDLRQGSAPRQVISAHSKSVKCVRFQGNFEPSKDVHKEVQSSKVGKKGGVLNGKENSKGGGEVRAEGSSSQTSLASSLSSESDGLLSSGAGKSSSAINTTVVSNRLNAADIISPIQNPSNEGTVDRTLLAPNTAAAFTGVGIFSPLTGDISGPQQMSDGSFLTYRPAQLSDGSNEQCDTPTSLRDSISRPLKEIQQPASDRSERIAVRNATATNSASTWISGDRFSGLIEPTDEQFDEGPITKRSSTKISDRRGGLPSAAVDMFSSPPTQQRPSTDLQVASNTTSSAYVASRNAFSKPSSSELSNSLSARASKSELVANSNISTESAVVNRSNGGELTPLQTPDEALPTAVGMANGVAAGGLQEPLLLKHVRGIVQEASEELREELSQHVLNLHTDMLKQFVIFQSEMRSMLQEQYSVNANLREENERLKVELNRLKKVF